MRLASFNVENLFDRAKALDQATWAEGKPILDKFARLNALLGSVRYTPAAKAKMVALMIELGLEKSDEAPFVILRRNRGKLLRRPAAGGIEIVADGRADWTGSLELVREPVDEVATQNTARVIRDLAADVMTTVEVESRPVLSDFNRLILPAVGAAPFRHVMLIDGNDPRGIDVGLVTRADYPIGSMRSHVDDCDAAGNAIFSRDCPEYEIATPAGGRLLLLVNHFKSKGFGTQASSNARRLAQATRVRAIYEARRAEGFDDIAVLGDFNDSPDGAPLAPLLGGTDLADISTHTGFDDGGFPGTFGAATAGNKIDYILLSPALFAKASGGGIFRKGMWPGVRPRKWDAYPELTRQEEAASDHGAIWADLDL